MFVALLLLQIVPVSSQGWRMVANAPCGLILQIPVGWETQKVTKDFDPRVECSVGLRPSGWLATAQRSKYELDESAIYIDTLQGSLEDACDSLGVCRDSDGWYFRGRLGVRTEGRQVRHGSATVISGLVETGHYRKGGGHLASAEAQIALVSEGSRLRRFLAHWSFDNEAVFDEIVRRSISGEGR